MRLISRKRLPRKRLLEGYIDLIRHSVPTPIAAAKLYAFHPEVERISADLLRDGHYRQAVLDAQILVINALKAKAGLPGFDGSPLVDRALSIPREGPPLIQVNASTTQADRDEQQGFFFLFKGLAMLRNNKAHTTALLTSVERALEYLSLCSLLHRVLDSATVNNSPSNPGPSD